MPGAGAQQDQDFFKAAAHLLLHDRIRIFSEWLALQEGHDFPGKFLRRCHDIHQSRVDDAAGHAVELRGRRLLSQSQPGLFLDVPQTERAIRTHS